MRTKGSIFYHDEFRFSDGEIGQKLLVLLNTPAPTDPLLLVKTTSRQKNKPATPGCLLRNRAFFCGRGTCFFEKDTWIELFEVYEMEQKPFYASPHVSYKGCLDPPLVDAVVQCLMDTGEDDLTPHQLKLLKPPLNNALQRLADKFNTKPK